MFNLKTKLYYKQPKKIPFYFTVLVVDKQRNCIGNQDTERAYVLLQCKINCTYIFCVLWSTMHLRPLLAMITIYFYVEIEMLCKKKLKAFVQLILLRFKLLWHDKKILWNYSYWSICIENTRHATLEMVSILFYFVIFHTLNNLPFLYT